MDPSKRVMCTLVLDMDGTLLKDYDEMRPIDEGFEFFEVKFTWPNGKERRKYVYKRPGLNIFLKKMAKLFEIVVFTASNKERADCYLDQIDKDQCIGFRIYRESCSPIEGKFIKDLSRLGRDLRRVIIVDDNPNSYELHETNAIRIKPFKGLKSDSKLKKLIPFLKRLSQVEDVRRAIGTKYIRHHNVEREDDEENGRTMSII